ncbi:MAG TPA: thiamine pyrophosphate-dependent enzyme [Dehalococcoidia bacterium]
MRNTTCPSAFCLFNNGGYGILKRMQIQQFDSRHIGVELRQPDFVKFAESLGVKGMLVERPEDLAGTLWQALAVNEPRSGGRGAARRPQLAHRLTRLRTVDEQLLRFLDAMQSR